MHDASVGATRRVAPTPITLPSQTLGAIIGQFKSVVTKRIRQMPDIDPNQPVWQRSYDEHIIRHQADLDRIRGYIETNPARWRDDSLFSP